MGGGVLAFDVGGTTTRAAIVTNGEVRDRVERPSVRGDGLARSLASIARDLLQAAGPAVDRERPCCISVPGPLSLDRRRIAFTGNLDLHDYPLADLLEAELAQRVVIDDDANCAALGEATFGAARGTTSSVTLVVGTGVGAGLIIGGDLYRGAHSLAGELGHVLVERGGRLCSCGRQGCLEAMANGAALHARAGKAFASAADVFAAAEQGDELALAAVKTTADYLAIGIAAAVSMLDPECVVLAGGLGRQPLLVEAAAARACELCVEPLGRLLDVRVAVLGDDAGLLGAAMLARAEAGH